MTDTYRVYLRWSGQRVSQKTVTSDRAVAEHVLNALYTSQHGQPSRFDILRCVVNVL